MLIPSRPLLALLVLLVAAAVVASAWPPALPAWLALAGAIAAAAALDAWRAWRRPSPRVRRRVAHALSLGVEQGVDLLLESVGRGDARVRVFDQVPARFAFSGLPLALSLPAGATASVDYRIRPLARGDHAFGPVELRLASPWRLWERRVAAGDAVEVKVYPNFAALTRYALLAADHRLSQIGLLRRRRRGLGLEFHQLREYREGDTQRQIDWKATARIGRLVSREYQDERDQQIVLLLDCGRRMAARDGALSHMDHALDAAMLLAYVGLRQGDAVGLATLGGPVRWLPPRKSMAALDALLARTYDLEPTLSNPDFHAAAVELMRRLGKRAWVVIVSNVRDEDDETLVPAIRLLRTRHRVVVASLRETILAQALARPVHGLDEALTHAATAEYLERRAQSFQRLAQREVPCLDVEPPALAMALVNRYIALKRSGGL